MPNLVLYRKYRPKLFSEVIGQEHIIKTLEGAISEGIFGHAYLFSGPRGCGKTTVARLLAKALNCQKRKSGEFEPCNQCDSCLEISEGRAIDLIEIDAASNRGIDEIRELKEGIRFLPAKSKFKVFILDEAHQLSKDAANALLKTLEEPPGHAIFILATTEANKMIPTILSRCQKFDFRRLKLGEIVGRLESILQQEKIKFEKEALSLIAAHAAGSSRDAESLLDEAVSFFGQDGLITKKEIEVLLGLADIEAVFKFIGFLSQKKAKEAVDFIADLMEQGIDIKEFLQTVIMYFREILLLHIDVGFQDDLLFGLSEEEKAKLRDLAKSFSEQQTKQILEIFTDAENKMKYATILQLPLEMAVVEICIEN
ncbi:MAG: DNA polymerase III subunit gamma/tau [Patescibacteria group bacterium]|nr:DNA polymerase III subunit gamma/tau [Patescibacteria group bacterium]